MYLQNIVKKVKQEEICSEENEYEEEKEEIKIILSGSNNDGTVC